jgi:hypothetical protein
MDNMKQVILIIFISCLLFQRCTNNPLFSDDGKATDKHIVTGSLSLSDGSSPLDAYVWVQDLDISARCNSQGSFTLQIPKTQEYEGLNGSYTVYFYVGNYQYQTASVVVTNGLFEYGQHNITDDGHFDKNIVLKKLLNIETNVVPNLINLDESLNITLTSSFVNTDSFVSIIIQTDKREPIMYGYFMRPVDTGSPVKYLYKPSETKSSGIVLDSLRSWETFYFFNPDSVAPGQYEIIPYVQVQQSGLPAQLLLSIGANANKYSFDYLNVPFTRKTAFLTIF